MQKKAAKQTTQHRTDSPVKKSGLIAKGKNSKRSARTKSVLDNRSHRTDMQITGGRLLRRRDVALPFSDAGRHTNVTLPFKRTRPLVHLPVRQLAHSYKILYTVLWVQSRSSSSDRPAMTCAHSPRKRGRSLDMSCSRFSRASNRAIGSRYVQ